MRFLNYLRSLFSLEENGDIADYFGKILPKLTIVLLAEQLILTYFDKENPENFFVTAFVCFVLLCILIIRNQTNVLNIKNSSYYIYSLAIVGLSIWWFYTDGLNGATGYYFSFMLFSSIALFEKKHHKYTIGFSLAIYILLAIAHFAFPSVVHPYGSKTLEQLDIISASLFSMICVVMGFSYIKNAYEEKQKQLIEKVEYQERLNEELDNFVYKTSHDLRSPLTSCMGLIDIARNSKDIDEIHRYLAFQQKSLEKMDKFINDILYYSRNQRLDISNEKVSFSETYEDVIEQIKFLKGSERMDFRFTQKTERLCYTDSLRMQMVIKNIVSNAIYYQDMAKEKPYLHLTIDFDEVNKLWLLSFADNGQGISAAILPRIFDMFYRGNTQAEGSGVGLYIVKQVIHKLNGEVTCTSEYGLGSTFSLYFPDTSPLHFEGEHKM
ncbi:MAG: sensor histidine kinase [Bacteroidia bacterium]